MWAADEKYRSPMLIAEWVQSGGSLRDRLARARLSLAIACNPAGRFGLETVP